MPDQNNEYNVLDSFQKWVESNYKGPKEGFNTIKFWIHAYSVRER